MKVIEKIVSIIIPVYNAEHYLEGILSDLISQTYQNIEIIIINDGSKDRSAEIIQEFARKDNRIQYIVTENGGPSRARNLGLEIAQGEYIRFVDADDRLPLDSIQNMVDAIERNVEADIVIGNYTIDKQEEYFTGIEIEEGLLEPKVFAELFVKHMKTFYFGVPWNKLYRREIIEKHQLRFNESVIWCEDVFFNIEYYSKSRKMYILNVSNGVYKYCTRDTGITSGISKKSIKEIDEIETLRYQYMQDYCRVWGIHDYFELEWKHAELFEHLIVLTRYFRNDSLRAKYKKFQEYLKSENVLEYLCGKYRETHNKVWKVLEEGCRKNKHNKTFSYFLFKGLQYKYMNKWYKTTEMNMIENEIRKR